MQSALRLFDLENEVKVQTVKSSKIAFLLDYTETMEAANLKCYCIVFPNVTAFHTGNDITSYSSIGCFAILQMALFRPTL